MGAILHYVTLAIAVFVIAFSVEQSQSAVCMNHKSLVQFLGDRYAEAPRALGLVEDRGLVEVFVSDNGTWTIVMTTAQGIACILAAGDEWEEMERPEGPEY